MILGTIILLLIGVIAFFHYVQGFFSATISAILTMIAAIMAVSYHETVVNTLLKGKIADEADAMVLCVLFAAIYIILRLIFDSAVPGNVRMPVLVDKIGSAVMGIIAGIFTTGIFALAAQALPFGPSVGMYSRFPLKDKQPVVVPTNRQQEDSFVYDELNGETLDAAQEKSLLIPVDDILLAAVNRASDGGAMAGDQTFASIHPNYPAELFADRLGIQVGAKRTAMNLGGVQQIQVPGVYSVSSLPTAEPEFTTLRTGRKLDPLARPKKPGDMLLVLRVQVDHNAADDADSYFRFSMASVRLVANGKNYYPLGTVDRMGSDNVLFMQKLDDFIFMDLKAGDAAVDVAFMVDKNDVLAGGAKGKGGAPGEQTINDGVFVEVKRLAQVDLSGKTVSTSYSAQQSVMRKQFNLDDKNHSHGPSASAAGSSESPGGSAPTPAATAKLPLASSSIKTSTQISRKIGVNTTDVDAQNVAVAGGTISLKDSKLAVVSIDPTDTVEKLAMGDNQLTELFVPAGKQLVQINSTKPGADPWEWASQLGSLALVDAANTRYSPNGVVTVVKDGERSGLLMRYATDRTVSSVTQSSGAPGVVTYLFIVPSGTQLRQISVNGQQATIDFVAQ